METQESPLLSWAYFCQGKTVEELNHSLLCMTLELQQTKAVAQEELMKKDEQLIHLKNLLSKAIKERDEAEDKCHKLFLEKHFLEQQQQQGKQQIAPLSGTSSIEDEPIIGIDSYSSFWSSDCEESIVSSPIIDPIQLPPKTQLPQPPISQLSIAEETLALVSDKPLPEKGKLLQAVIKAGPLLQTLLVAGPLPQWKHPPPPLESFEIPQVTIPSQLPEMPLHDSFINITNCDRVNRKRVHFDGSESHSEVKYQRVVLH